MSRRQAGSVLQYLNQFIGSSAGSADSDAQLLQRFAARRDEAAFAELVRRHGRLVWSVCRRLLGHDQDAEDAFQATFVILADKAASIRKRKSLASWLYGVAARTAWNARKSARRRRYHERHAEEPSGESPMSAASLRELQSILDEEVQRLPEKYQAPFILCCLEGKGRAEAARLLGWKEGTVSSRLAQARERLQKRLGRRGVELSAALCAGALSSDAISATVPVALGVAAARTATGAVSAQALLLAKGVLKSMIVTRLKVGVALVLILGSLAAGGAAAIQRIGTKKPTQAPPEAASKPAEQRRADIDIHGDPLPPGAVARLGTTRFRAGAGIYTLAFSPNGKIIASSSNENVIRLWDAASGKQIRELASQWNESHALAFSPDGKTLAVGMVIYELESGRLIDKMNSPDLDVLAGTATSVAFSPDGKLLVTGHKYNKAYLWDVASRKPFQKLEVRGNSPVNGIAFSPDGKIVATGVDLDQRALQLWDVATGRERYGVRGHGRPGNDVRGNVLALAFSPDGRMLASGHSDGTLHLWELASGRRRHSFRGHETGISSLSFSPNRRLLAASSFDAPIYIWDVTGTAEQPRRRLSDAELRRCWTDLASTDAVSAFRVVCRLAGASEQTLPFLCEHLKPVPAPDRKRVRQLVDRLDSADFLTRQKAAEELEKQADAAVSLLREMVAKEKPSLEVRRRLQHILEGIESKPESLRAARAVEVLEWIATPDAVRLIDKLANGAADTRLTREAVAAKRRRRR